MKSLFATGSLILLSLAGLFADRDEDGSHRMMQGPMLGSVTPDSINVWARLNGPYPAMLEVARDPYFQKDLMAFRAQARQETDYCILFQATGLEPGTEYFYRFRVAGEKPKYFRKYPPFSFQTAPLGHAEFTVGLGSCVRFQEDPIQTIWLEVAKQDPDLFFWLGDNIYGDSLIPEILAEEYRRQRNIPYLQQVNRTIPQLATWDDHDFGLNDHDRTNPVKEGALEVFKTYWANPSYGLPETPGVFFQYTYGGVDFFFLDGRYYRDPYYLKDDENKTLLGVAQMQWLKRGLQSSKAPFKVLICGSGWTSLKGPEGDSWSSMLTERNALFQWITDNQIEGVVLVSGDVHRSELNIIPWSERGGYDFYEFVSSPLAQGTSDKRRPEMWEIAFEDPIVGAASFGILDFDLTVKDPILRYRVIDALGHQHYENFQVRASELVPGKASWMEKVSKQTRAQHERYRSLNP